MKDVTTMPRKEEYVRDMVQRERLAVMKSVLIRHLRREEYAKGIGRRGSRVEKLEIEAKDL